MCVCVCVCVCVCIRVNWKAKGEGILSPWISREMFMNIYGIYDAIKHL